MKLSNKILVGFFGFIFLYLTASFAELRINGTPNVIDDTNSKAETVDFSGISYIVINNIDKQINIVASDRSQLEVRSLAGDYLSKLKYRLSGDTLTLSDFDSEGVKSIRISVFVPTTTLKGISVNGSSVFVRGLDQELLNVSEKSGRIWINGSTIKKIQTDIDQSYFEVSDSNLDTLSVNAENSELQVQSAIGLMQGSLKDRTSLRLTDIEEIHLKKDKSSDVRMY